jgi:protein ImuB
VDRLACVNVPELPLQLLLRDNPAWRAFPVVVVDDDSPRGIVMWSNIAARRSGIHAGLRYAVALSLCTELRAGVVAESRIAASVDALHALLREVSPVVEASAAEPGVFWLDASGLQHVYPTLEAWAQTIHGRLIREHTATVVVGFDRLCTYAVAKTRSLLAQATPTFVFDDARVESAIAHKVGLRDLGLLPSSCDVLEKLGVTSLAEFVRLPAGGLRERFGVDAFRLHQAAAQVYAQRLTQTAYTLPATEQIIFDDAETDIERLTFAVKAAMHDLFHALAKRGEALVKLTLELLLEKRRHSRHADSRRETVTPAVPTLDLVQVSELVHLRLSACGLEAGVIEIRLIADSVKATDDQLGLFELAQRDVAAAGRALARLRAELGEEAVVRAVPREAHLPEAQFAWEPALNVAIPHVSLTSRERPLVRRFFPKPSTLSSPPRHLRNDGWLLAGMEAGAVQRLHGPYVISGGWWRREVQRHYYFAALQNDEILWIYYDVARRQWFLQGRVE